MIIIIDNNNKDDEKEYGNNNKRKKTTVVIGIREINCLNNVEREMSEEMKEIYIHISSFLSTFFFQHYLFYFNPEK
jgi:hypothetical protein